MLHLSLSAPWRVKLGVGVAVGVAVGGLVAGGLALAGQFDGDPAPPAVSQYLGQDTLATCVDSQPVLGAMGQAQVPVEEPPPSPDATPQPGVDNAALEEAVNEALEHGRNTFWMGTYLETTNIAIAQGCPP
jgi:hypothetical protein